MELIWRHVFDADVLPMLLFAEARPPKQGDKVIVRHVDEASVNYNDSNRKARPTFDLSIAPESRLPYEDLFTPEGRIATRLTPKRASIARKLRALDELGNAAKPYWTKRKGGYRAVDTKPIGVGEALWEERRMIAGGVARRGTGTEHTRDGLDVYKGENIRTGSLVGEPQFERLDVANLSDPSVWRFPELLPSRMWCLPVIEQIPCAAPFDPTKVTVTNTATVFGPRTDLEAFPFDMLLTSRIYGWITLLSLRSSYQNKLRNHMYHTIISKLPWSENLTGIASDLEALRGPFFSACLARFDVGAELERQSADLALVPLKKAFKMMADKVDVLVLSPEFDTGEEFTLIVPDLPDKDDILTLMISEFGHSITFPNTDLVNYAYLGLALAEGKEMTKSKLLNMPIPQDHNTAQALRDLLATLDPVSVEAQVETHVDAIDCVVGAALGLLPEEISFVQMEMRNDSFLSRVRPRYPHFTPALRGRRTSLERTTRYG